MPAVIAADFGKMALAPETEEVLVCLIELRHRTLHEPVRIASDGIEVDGHCEMTGDPVYVFRSCGKTYYRYPFSFIAPGNARDNENSKARFVLANDPQIVRIIRGISDGVRLKACFVLASAPDEVEYDIPELLLDEVEITSGQISATLSYDHFYNEDVPALSFTQAATPGLFR